VGGQQPGSDTAQGAVQFRTQHGITDHELMGMAVSGHSYHNGMAETGIACTAFWACCCYTQGGVWPEGGAMCNSGKCFWLKPPTWNSPSCLGCSCFGFLEPHDSTSDVTPSRSWCLWRTTCSLQCMTHHTYSSKQRQELQHKPQPVGRGPTNRGHYLLCQTTQTQQPCTML
jgi:hypothetical protein